MKSFINKSFAIEGTLCDFNLLQKKISEYKKNNHSLYQKIAFFLENWFDNSDFIELKTSGSTGIPKKIIVKKKQMINSALATGKYLNLMQGNKAICCLPVDFISGKMMIIRALTLGLDLYFTQPSLNPLASISGNFDFIAMTPMQVENSLSELGRIKKIILGGASISNDLERKLQMFDNQIFVTYGMTETLSHIAIRKINQSEEKRKIYEALPDVFFEKDNRNCLIISCKKVCDEKIITNDIVDLINETSFEWKGRWDNVINSGGIKIFPEEIELKLSEIIKENFFIAAEKDNVLGEKIILFLEKKSEKYSDILEKIKEKNVIERYKIPKKVYFLEKFIYTETGKIQRNETMKLAFQRS